MENDFNEGVNIALSSINGYRTDKEVVLRLVDAGFNIEYAYLITIAAKHLVAAKLKTLEQESDIPILKFVNRTHSPIDTEEVSDLEKERLRLLDLLFLEEATPGLPTMDQQDQVTMLLIVEDTHLNPKKLRKSSVVINREVPKPDDDLAWERMDLRRQNWDPFS